MGSMHHSPTSHIHWHLSLSAVMSTFSPVVPCYVKAALDQFQIKYTAPSYNTWENSISNLAIHSITMKYALVKGIMIYC